MRHLHPSIKHNTRLLALGTAFALALGAGTAVAQPAAAAPSAVPGQPGTLPLELTADAPDRHIVVRGDTLWDIAAKFLQKPWRWPEIWQLNREQIANPHLIYPGDVIVLDRSGATPRLRLARAVTTGAGDATGDATGAAPGGPGSERVERLQPRVRTSGSERGAIPTVDIRAIEAFLSRPLVVDEKGLLESPRIVSAQEGRVFLGRGDAAYVRGVKDETTDWHVYRQARPLLDPVTRLPIAFEALFIGAARIERKGDPATIRITQAGEEIGIGDRLLPAERAPAVTYAPSPPSARIDGRIVAVHRGVSQAGRDSVVALNVGKADGLELGNVLRIFQAGQTIRDRETREMVQLPDEPTGHVLVFRVFDKIAYGLIVSASQAIEVGDAVRNP